MGAPTRLRAADIRAQLATVLRDRPPRPVALHGSGQRQELTVGEHTWRVFPVGSELELRRVMVGAESHPATALLVDYTDQLPLDVACRVAGARVHSVDRGLRIAHFFGARRAAPALVGSALGALLLDEMPEDIAPILGTVIQHEEAWARYLGLRLGWGAAVDLSAEGLLRQGLRDPDAGPALARRRSGPVWDAALAELEQVVRTRGGASAVVVLGALLAGQLEPLLGWLLLIDAARRAGSEAALSRLRLGLDYTPGFDRELAGDDVAGPLTGLLRVVIPGLEQAARQRLWEHAAAQQPREDFGVALRHSPWLPAGRDALDDALSRILSERPPDRETLVHAVELLDRLGQHHLVRDDEHGRRTQAVREAGLRLLAWLVWRPHPESRDVVGVTGLAELLRWAEAEAGWVDRAREVVRRHTTHHAALDAALRDHVLAKVDATRRELDRVFAHALVAWQEAGRPKAKVMGIEHVLARVGAAFLEGAPTRRLLVLVMDGMSLSVAARIRDAFEHWRPIAWRPAGPAPAGAAVAALPTLTKTSRAALFAGRHDRRAGDRPQSDDRSRFETHPKLAAVSAADEPPALFLKGEIGTNGTLSDQLVDAMRSADRRVLGVVINAVDDQLGGSDQYAETFGRPQAIPLVDALLRLAEDTRRTVLLTSDHGHVDASVLVRRPRPERSGGKSARWRTLGDGEAHLDAEIQLPDSCWRPAGEGPVAAPWDERVCWGSDSKGAHGGVSIAEAVVPVRLLAPPWFREATGGAPDDELATGEVQPPRWWRLEVPRAASAPAPAPKAAPPSGQLSLLPPAPAPAAVAKPPPRGPSGLVKALKQSPLFQAYEREVGDARRVARALEYIELLARSDGRAMSTGAFARAAGIRPHRLRGQVARDTAFLNADGVTLVEVDPAADQVRLHVERLRAQYGIVEGSHD